MKEATVKYIDVNDEIVTEVERLHYSYENYKDVVQSCLDLHKLDPDASFLESPIFKGYQDQMSEACAAYNVAKAEIEKTFVPKEYRDNGCTWNLNFTTNQLEIKAA